MLAQIRDTLNSLPPRQRLTLIAVSLLILAGLGLAVSHHREPAEVPLLSGKAFTPDGLEQARLALHKRGLFQFRVDGQRLLVSIDNVARYNAALVEQSELPGRFGENWEQALEKSSWPFESDRERQERLDVARAKELVTMIRQIPQIADARIVWSNARQKSWSGESRRTAILSVTPRADSLLTSQLYQSLQRTVASAWSMAEHDVTIVNTATGQSFREPEPAGAVSTSVTPANPRETPRPESPGFSLSADQASVATMARSTDSPPPAGAIENPPKPRKTRSKAGIGVAGSPWAVPTGVGSVALLSLVTLARRRKRASPSIEPATDSGKPAEGPVREISLQPAPDLLSTSRANAPKSESVAAQPSPSVDKGVAALDRPGSIGDDEPASATRGDHRQPSSRPLQFLEEAEPGVLLSFVTDERPQTIALILSQLPGPLAAKVLQGLPSTKRLEVGRRVASLEGAPPEAIQDVARGLRNRIVSNMRSPGDGHRNEPAGTGRLRRSAPFANRRWFETVEIEDAALADRIRRMAFVFDDLLKLDGNAIAVLYPRIDCSKWALALKGSSEELKSKILEHLSPLATIRLQNELNEIGPVRLSDVAAAQQQIAFLVRQLEDAGEIVVDSHAETMRMIA